MMCLFVCLFVCLVIATSGIDYDVKLWEPLDSERCSLHDLDKVSIPGLYQHVVPVHVVTLCM